MKGLVTVFVVPGEVVVVTVSGACGGVGGAGVGATIFGGGTVVVAHWPDHEEGVVNWMHWTIVGMVKRAAMNVLLLHGLHADDHSEKAWPIVLTVYLATALLEWSHSWIIPTGRMHSSST